MNPSIHHHTLADIMRRSAARDPGETAIVCGATCWSHAHEGPYAGAGR